MTSRAPQVSVIMPVFNGAAYLAFAIDSVLAQTFQDWELIVIDDGSNDASALVAQAYTDPRIRFLKNLHNLGLPLTRNRGLDKARGNYVAFLDSDDIALPQRLQKQIDFLEANPGIAAVGASAQLINAQGQVIGSNKGQRLGDRAYCKARLLFGAYFTTSSFTARAQVLRENRFDLSMALAEDHDLYIRLCERHCLVNLPQILIQYRIHGGNITTIRRQELAEVAEDINRRQLIAIGIQPTAHELLIHRHIEWLDMTPSAELLTEVSAWLLRILNHNQRIAVYDAAALRQAAGERWHAVCENALRGGYRSAWLMFYRSPLCNTRALGVAGHVKLAARLVMPRHNAKLVQR
jgi:glycosyltransferase involved in cell wall biosynthesis